MEYRDESNPSYFPENIMYKIFARLAQECLNELRYECKQWHGLISTSKSVADSFRRSQPALLIQVPTSSTMRNGRTKLLELDEEGLGFKYKKFGNVSDGKGQV